MDVSEYQQRLERIIQVAEALLPAEVKLQTGLLPDLPDVEDDDSLQWQLGVYRLADHLTPKDVEKAFSEFLILPKPSEVRAQDEETKGTNDSFYVQAKVGFEANVGSYAAAYFNRTQGILPERVSAATLEQRQRFRNEVAPIIRLLDSLLAVMAVESPGFEPTMRVRDQIGKLVSKYESFW